MLVRNTSMNPMMPPATECAVSLNASGHWLCEDVRAAPVNLHHLRPHRHPRGENHLRRNLGQHRASVPNRIVTNVRGPESSSSPYDSDAPSALVTLGSTSSGGNASRPGRRSRRRGARSRRRTTRRKRTVHGGDGRFRLLLGGVVALEDHLEDAEESFAGAFGRGVSRGFRVAIGAFGGVFVDFEIFSYTRSPTPDRSWQGCLQSNGSR